MTKITILGKIGVSFFTRAALATKARSSGQGTLSCMVRGYLAAILLWSLLACGIVLAAGFDLLSPCSPSLPYYVDVGRYNIPEDLDVDLRIRSGVVTNERNRYRTVMEYASKLGSDLANQTIIMEV